MISVLGSASSPQICEFSRQMHRLGDERILRAIQVALNSVVMEAKRRITAVLPDSPTPSRRKPPPPEKGDLKGSSLRDSESVIAVKDAQSIYLKYLIGANDNVQRSGNVGLFDKAVGVPIWENIEHSTGVRPKRNGDLLRSAMKRVPGRRVTTFWWAAPEFRLESDRRPTGPSCASQD